MKALIIISILISPILGSLYSPDGFFTTSDLTAVTWANAVNSQQILNETLSDPLFRMIEADVCRGRERINGTESIFDIAIMAQPPNITSDLSFKRFIDILIDYNRDKPVDERKGIKLDFKDYFSLASAVSTMRLRNMNSNGTAIQFPVWLNADVMRESDQGYAESPDKITIPQIIKLHRVSLPNAVLSLWWNSTKQLLSYRRQHYVDMISDLEKAVGDPEILKDLPVTFNLRAGPATRSLGDIRYLLSSTSLWSTITLNGKEGDSAIEQARLDDFMKVIGKNRTFVDAPFKFTMNSAGNIGFDFVFVLFTCSLRYFLCSLWA